MRMIAHLHFVALLHDFLRMVDAVVGHLRDMDQALDRVVDLGERAEVGQPGDLGGDDLADDVALARPCVQGSGVSRRRLRPMRLRSSSTFIT